MLLVRLTERPMIVSLAVTSHYSVLYQLGPPPPGTNPRSRSHGLRGRSRSRDLGHRGRSSGGEALNGRGIHTRDSDSNMKVHDVHDACCLLCGSNEAPSYSQYFDIFWIALYV